MHGFRSTYIYTISTDVAVIGSPLFISTAVGDTVSPVTSPEPSSISQSPVLSVTLAATSTSSRLSNPVPAT